jgi:hypothetical protein
VANTEIRQAEPYSQFEHLILFSSWDLFEGRMASLT